MSIQLQIQTILANQQTKLTFALPPKKINKKPNKKPQKPIKPSPPKKLAYKVLVPEPIGLSPAECASLRALVHVIDPEIKGELPMEKWNLFIKYWQELIAKYNTAPLRASIPEQAKHDEDSDEEAERTGISLDETDDEADVNDEDENEEFKDFIASEGEIEDEGDEGDEGEEDEYEEEEEEVIKEEDSKKRNNNEEEQTIIKKKIKINIDDDESITFNDLVK